VYGLDDEEVPDDEAADDKALDDEDEIEGTIST
jgi:hypothetical protein